MDSATITNCYSTGALTQSNSGGIAGNGFGSSSFTISNCYSNRISGNAIGTG